MNVRLKLSWTGGLYWAALVWCPIASAQAVPPPPLPSPVAPGTVAPSPAAGGAAPPAASPGVPGAAPPAASRSTEPSAAAASAAGTTDRRLPTAPTDKQLAALRSLTEEAELYQKAANDYRKVLTLVVRHHFQERRRRIISGLDQAVQLEQEKLTEWRAETIRRLEEFIQVYSGPNAHPESTPDAMYRLAALYEERARADFDVELGQSLKPAIALYREIIAKFPAYSEVAGVHYYLAHAYNDSAEIETAQQVWRSLVCSNKFSVQADPTAADKLLLQPLPQDHSEQFWNDWYNKNPIPLDQAGGPGAASQSYGVAEEELQFINPYLGCEAQPQQVKEGEEARYLGEAWWQLGNYHFDGLDFGGPYALNRAAAAYENSQQYKKPPLYGVAMYKRAWTFFKQQRYEAAVRGFVKLLHHADDEEARTGDPGADFRGEAYTYIAGSLTFVDFKGPPERDPNIPRSDVLDTEQNPLAAESKMRIGLQRVQDPALIPQDKKWTVEIYKALAQEYIEIGQDRNAVDTIELTLQRFPLDREAPKMLNKVADLFDQVAREAKEGSAVKAEAAAAALGARTRLAEYVGDTDWTRANKNDPEALEQAEELVRRGLQRAAADHTNHARANVSRARSVASEIEQRALLEKAISEYRSAAIGWGAYIDQDPNAIDAYESRYWLADARFWVATLQLQLDQEPRDGEILAARKAAEAVRDSNEDDKFLQPAAFYLVTLSDKLLERRYREFERSGGARGFKRRDAVSFVGEGLARRPVQIQVPAEVTAAISARDEYNVRIDYALDPQKNGLLYAFQSAEFYFVYGQFADAQKRLEPIMDRFCGVNEWGYRAWEKLISMSNFQGDATRSRKLVEGRSCAFDEETRAAEDAIRTPVRQGVAYLDARKLYDEAESLPEGPERDAKWRDAAAAYKVALDAAPDRDEAPEAAMNGAFAYKQVGEYDKAIEMYSLFIQRYGNEAKLNALKAGDSSANPPVAPDPAKYENRAKFLKLAYDALANAYVLFFDYPEAAQTFDTISKVPHFSQTQRKESAQQAMNLYASLGDTGGMRAARNNFVQHGATPKEVAEADYVIAAAALKDWDQFSPDSGGNQEARKRAELAMRQYFDANKDNPDAAPFAVEASYWVAKMKGAARDSLERGWWEQTMAAFDRYRQSAPAAEDGTNSAVGSRQATMAAEGAFTLLDQELRTKFDYETGHHRFKGTPQQVIASYQAAAQEAKGWFDKLKAQLEYYGSPEWGTAAVARQGSLYDSLRSALYNVRAPELQMFDKKTEQILKRAEESDNLELQEKADALRIRVEDAWRDARDRELAGADAIMVDRYSSAMTMARRYNISNPAVVRAIQRLAFFTEVIGEAKLTQYTARVRDLGYSEGMFLRMRPGLVTAPSDTSLPKAVPQIAGQP